GLEGAALAEYALEGFPRTGAESADEAEAEADRRCRWQGWRRNGASLAICTGGSREAAAFGRLRESAGRLRRRPAGSVARSATGGSGASRRALPKGAARFPQRSASRRRPGRWPSRRFPRLQHTVKPGPRHIHGADLHTMPARVLDERARRIDPHGLRIQDGRRELRRVVVPEIR